jgi:hypothetical protein
MTRQRWFVMMLFYNTNAWWFSVGESPRLGRVSAEGINYGRRAARDARSNASRARTIATAGIERSHGISYSFWGMISTAICGQTSGGSSDGRWRHVGAPQVGQRRLSGEVRAGPRDRCWTPTQAALVRRGAPSGSTRASF